MFKNLNTNHILVAIFVCFLLFVGYVHKQNRLLDEKYKNIKQTTTITKPILITQDTYRKEDPKFSHLEFQPKTVTADETQPLKVFLSNRSQQALESFKLDARIDIKTPETFDYINLDLDNNMAGVYGYDPITKAKVTSIAYGNKITSDKVIDLLKSNADYIPNLNKTKILNVSPEVKLPPLPKESGLSSGSLWNGKLANGDEFAAVFLPRQDNKGVYFLMLTGSPSYFKNNDGAFDALYDNAKALPANSR